MKKVYVILDWDSVLKEGIIRSAEVLELQRILKVIEDGNFGKHTLQVLRLKISKDSVSLKELHSMGYSVQAKILESKLWWLNK